MKKHEIKGVIMPTLLEPNGKVGRFSKIAEDPKIREAYKEILKNYKTHPEELAKKLREATWGKKSVDEIAAELSHGKHR